MRSLRRCRRALPWVAERPTVRPVPARAGRSRPRGEARRRLLLGALISSLLLGTAAAQLGGWQNIVRVSVSSDGTEANAESGDPLVSADGRFVLFASNADNLVPGDSNDTADVFVRDRLTKTTERVSLSANGTPTNGGSGCQRLTAQAVSLSLAHGGRRSPPGRSRHGSLNGAETFSVAHRCYAYPTSTGGRLTIPG